MNLTSDWSDEAQSIKGDDRRPNVQNYNGTQAQGKYKQTHGKHGAQANLHAQISPYRCRVVCGERAFVPPLSTEASRRRVRERNSMLCLFGQVHECCGLHLVHSGLGQMSAAWIGSSVAFLCGSACCLVGTVAVHARLQRPRVASRIAKHCSHQLHDTESQRECLVREYPLLLRQTSRLCDRSAIVN